jgi:hypothetical protein
VRGWDAFGGNPDPSLQLNSHPSACAENIHDVTLSLHGLSLTIGDTVQATAVDVDLRRDDLAGTDSVTFEGWPLSLRGDHFSATCRALTPATVQARLPARQDAARQALSRLQQAMVPAPLQDNWGWPESEERTARRHIEDVAGHVGWTDAAAGALLANEAGLQAQWSEAVAASMAQTRASLPRTVTLSTGLTISITAMQCADDCQLTLSLRGPDRPLTFSPGSDLSLYLVLPDGRDHGLSISDELPEGVLSLAAGEQTDLHLHTSSVPSDRSMVRIKESNRQHLLPTPGS